MASHFLGIYICDKNVINTICGSGDKNYASQLLLNDDELPYIEKLLNRDYNKDPDTNESEDADSLIYAFEHICRKECIDKNISELYIHDEETPELWEFQIGGWSGSDELNLPLSSHGTPTVTYIDGDELKEHQQKLSRLAKSGKDNTPYISDDELNSIVTIIEGAIERELGVYVFFSI